MRTLKTGLFLAYALLRYEKLMNDEFKTFLKNVIIGVDTESEIMERDADTLINTLYVIQDEQNYSDEMVESFLGLIELHEVNVRKPCPMID